MLYAQVGEITLDNFNKEESYTRRFKDRLKKLVLTLKSRLAWPENEAKSVEKLV